MNPLEIFSVILPLIEEIPSIEGSVSALIKAVEAMVKEGGSDPLDILKTILGILPAVSQAVVANAPPSSASQPTSGTAAA